MAPTSDKRSHPQPQPLLKDNVYVYTHPHSSKPGSAHTKENTSSTKNYKKSLEILDFHESWLEEMEIYKGRIFMQQQFQQKQFQQLLSQQNRANPLQGSQLQSHNKLSVNNNLSANISATNNPPDIGKRRGHDHTNQNNKTRALSAAAAAAATSTAPLLAAAAAAADAQRSANVNVQYTQPFLKRAQEEASVSKSVPKNVKRHAPPHSRMHSHSHTRSSNSTPVKSGIVPTPTPNGKSTTKVIVNQFHASSLLNSHQHDEKSKILTQNGLTKSAASAYETSLYALNYLAQENRDHYSPPSGPKYPYADSTNYVGVSLAKSGEGDRPKDQHTTPTSVEDDPCAAIDELNNYTDTESEDEYTGCPFYLEEDRDETHQSRNIRYNEKASGIVENSEEDSSEYYKPKSILTPSIFPNVPPYLNFSSHAHRGPEMPAALHKVLKWKLSPVMPKIVRRVVLNSGFRIIKNTTDWMAVWEKHMKSPGFRTIRSHQKYNHMPGSFRIGRKDTMWRSIYHNMKKFGSKEFGFMQKSYIMPDDLEPLRVVWPKNASKLTKWIVKPPASARGTGIRIVNKWSQFPKDRPLVVQKYIERPLLINDNKFDMRIYVVLTSINPLRLYMYKDGLARFASVKYSSELNSLDDRCMHLTNYSINKFSQNYSKNEDFHACQGHKWTLQSLWSCLEARGVNTKLLWATLRNLVIKAIVSGESGLNRAYRQNVNFRYNCFELFGFDVLLDENLIPWLLEINISPSLHSELPLDLHVKGPLIQAVLNTALYQVPPKLSEVQEKEVLEDLKLEGPLCYDKRLFTTCLTAEEVRKHNLFTSRSIEFREEYIDTILDHLLPDDVRCLIILEDEYARCKPLERIFPTADTYVFLKYVDNPRYYNRLVDAWENKYNNCREEGIALLSRLCREGYHRQVSDAAMEKEPNVTLTEIDMLYTKKDDLNAAPTTDSGSSSKPNTSDGTSDSTGEPKVTVLGSPSAAKSGHTKPIF